MHIDPFEYVKLGVVLVGYCLLAPALGVFLRGRRSLQVKMLAAVLLMTAIPVDWYGVTVFDQNYRGTVRGFEASLIGGFAIALVTATALENPSLIWRWPRVFTAHVVYGLGCAASVVNCVSVFFWGAALHKHVTLGALLLAAVHVIRGERELRIIVDAIAAALLIEGALLVEDYVQGGYRSFGGFDHGNSMAMWAYWLGLCLLSTLLFSRQSWQRSLFWLLGVLASYFVVIRSVSRASLAACVLGSVCIVVIALLRQRSGRNYTLAACLVVLSVAAGFKAHDTFMERFGAGTEVEGVEDFRVILVIQANAMFRDHRIVGIGWNNYGLRNSRPLGNEYSWYIEDWTVRRGHRLIAENFTQNALPEHVYWLHLAENGILGFSTYVAFLLLAFFAVIRHRGQSPLHAALFLGLALAMLIGGAHGALERVMGQTKNLAAFLVVLGAYLPAPRPRGRSARPATLQADPAAPTTQRRTRSPASRGSPGSSGS